MKDVNCKWKSMARYYQVIPLPKQYVEPMDKLSFGLSFWQSLVSVRGPSYTLKKGPDASTDMR